MNETKPLCSEEINNLNDSLKKDILLIRNKIDELSEYDLIDEDGYPTEQCLEIIKIWHWSDPIGWFKFIKDHWWSVDWGWKEKLEDHEFKKELKVQRYYISTGGWSGNESIIGAMQENSMMWHFSWVQSRRGGHYIFEEKIIPMD